MISSKDIEKKLGKILHDANIAPIQFPNGPVVTDKPRLMCEHEIVSRTNPGLRAGGKIQKGIWIVKVITDKSVFTNPASDLAELVLPLYSFGSSFPIGDRVLRIYKEPLPLSGFPTEASWCLPLQFHYIVTGK